MKAAFTLSQSKTKSLTALFLAMVMACALLLAPRWGFAQTIVVDGTGTSQYVPMYNWYNDYGFRCEYVIPASYFSSAGITSGSRLTSITLYRSATGSWTAKDLTIKLTNTSTSYYSSTSFLGLNGTTVYSSSSYSGGTSSSYTFTFSSPFTYTGGSLVVHIYAGNGGTCASSSSASTWYGISSTSYSQSCYASGSNSANATTGSTLSFLPKTAFSYTAAATSHTLAGTIQCGQTVSGTLGTSGTWGTGSSPYNMNSGWGVGGEAVYAFTPQMTGTHTIAFNTTSGDPDFWVLSDNNPQTAIYATSGGNQSAELTAGHTYYLVADNYSSSSSAGYSIQVICPEPPVTVEVGSNSSNNSSIPTSCFYKYSLSQQIYKASEIGCTGTISQLSFYYNASTSETRTIVIYMKMTSNNTLSSYDSSPGTVVYSGSRTFTQGWNTITLSTSFNYSNICQNLMITVDDNTGSYTSSRNFATYSTGENRAMYGNSDNTNYSPTSSNTLSSTQYNNYIKLYMTNPTTYKILTLGTNDATMGSVSANPSGTYCTSTRAYPAGTTVTLTASATSGNIFANWTVDGATVTANPTTITMNDHHTVVANFSENPASIPYTENFESNTWKFVNGSRTNKWYRGDAGARNGSYGLFISNDGSNNTYNIESASAVWTYKTINFDETTNYAISFDWRAYGESSYDYIRVGLVPASTTLVDGESFSAPTGWIDLNNSTYLNQQSTWQRKTTIINVTAGNYKLAFCWRNDGSSGTNPPACIDNVEVKKALTVTVSAGTGGSASGGGTFVPNQRCTVTATPNSNYCFVNWTEGGSVVSTSPTYTFDVTANRTLVANFASTSASSIAVSGNSTSCGNTATLTASGLTGVTYNWYSDASCTNLVATGATLTTPVLYDNTTYYVKAVRESVREQYSTFNYTGSSQSYTIPSGADALKMEVWGAQGGGRQVDGNSNGGYGGNGGYSVGTLNNLSGVSSVYVYVGGQGQTSNRQSATAAPGGWNGGGTAFGSDSGDPACGGGGATDIRVNGTSLYYRIIVAGGGGGGGEDGEQGGYGGGTTGGTGSSSGTTGGTQTGGGTGYAFGIGASTQYDGGAGGGGWYGGGCGGGTQTIPTSNSSSDSQGGCGGSGYVWTSSTASSAPSEYSVSSSYYLTDAQTIAGNATMPNPAGGTMTGNQSNGYARITAIFNEVCETEAKAVTVTVNQPDAPTNVQVTNIGLITATASWSGSASSYKWRIDGSAWYTTSNTSVSLTGLTPGGTYTFRVKAVDGNCESSEASTTFTTESTHTLSASVNPSNSGTISDGNGNISGNVTYNHGTSVSLTATAAAGYTFQNWTVDGSMVSGNPTSITMDGDHTVTANFTQDEYFITLWANPSNGGQVTADHAGPYHYGETVTLTATTFQGHTFSHWSDDPTNTSNVRTVTVTAPAAYTAEFSVNTYTVNATANPTDGGTITGAGTFNYNTSCNLVATPNTGYSFVNWTDDHDNVLSTNTAYGFMVSDDANLTANFQRNTMDLTVTGGEWTYDGTAHTATVVPEVTEGTTLLYRTSEEDEWSTTEPSITNVGTLTVYVKATHANYSDATGNCTLTVNPAKIDIAITGNTSTVNYNGAAQSVTGYTASSESTLFDASKVVYNGSATATGTNAGTYLMTLDAEQFSYNDDNINATFTIAEDGKLTINPIDVTVTITGHNNTADYDGEEHTVTGYDVEISNSLYTTSDFTFSGTASASQTNVGTTNMGLADSQFANTNTNFGNVTFNVTDGYQTITPIDVTVAITGHNNTADYDGEEHTVSGYTATASSTLYDVDNDFTFSGTAAASQTNVGTTNMGLAASQFANTNTNFGTVTFNVTDGYQTITPIDVTVTITGHNNTADYDGEEHTVSGYDVEISNPLYTTDDFSFSGTASASQTNVGTTNMGLAASQFANNNTNFANVTFEVTDGYQTITPIDVTVTITGHNNTADYDGAEHTVSGYTATASSTLYDVDNDFTFSGTASASQTNVGTTNMGLAASQFANTNTNFGNVTFNVTDGYQTITPIDVTVTITGHNNTADYDGEEHTVTGYTATASSTLYDVDNDFTFSGTASASQTNVGTTNMGLAASQFANINTNFGTVTFNVTDGYQTITPIDVTVTITGHNNTADYDGEEHTVTGYDVEISNSLYTTSDFTFSGTASASQTNVGTTNMGLAASQFANTNTNFGNVTFNVTDGYQTITPIDVTVTITGHNNTADYDGTEHTVTGYTATASSNLYDVDNDFTFNGTASASQTNVGTTNMGLTASQFANTNTNFGTVTFNVTDGYQTITPIDVTVTIVGANNTAAYDGNEHTVTGYTATASSNLYDVDNDFTFNGTASASQTNVGTTNMGLAASQFANTNTNFGNVTFNVTDGYQTITPIDVTVTITGHRNIVNYDSEEHTVTGYDVEISNPLYTINDFTFSGDSTARRTIVGTTNMNLAANQFANTNTNFGNVTFNVTDGYQTITPIDVTVTITGHNNTADYDGTEHTVTGYTANSESTLFDATKVVFSGNTADSTASGTNVGEYPMGLAANMFSYNDGNINATFSVTDGSIEITPIDVTVTIVGANNTAAYDGNEHTVSGYTATASSNLYDVDNDFTFSGTATAARTDAGTTNMGLTATMFTNNNTNFGTVTFNVTDGYQTITPIDVTVIITGHRNIGNYDSEEHTVTGYDVEISNPLYTVNDFTFSGDSTASRTEEGTSYMGLTAEQFTNTNTNFANVTFSVTDGYQAIHSVNTVIVTITGHRNIAYYDSEEHTMTGYDVEISNPLYTVNDFTYSGDSTATRTNVGTTNMGLDASQFANTNTNFANVTFEVIDGFQTIIPAAITIAVTGNTGSKVYNGQAQSVTGYTVSSESNLFDATKVVFSGNAADSTASGTNVGEYPMGLAANMFSYNDGNINATFSVTDGSIEITPIDVTVAITGNHSSVAYDGTEHTVTGYTATTTSTLYDVDNDFTFSGTASASQTNVGTTNMGLVASQFANNNTNFANVTFEVIDGFQTIIPAAITIAVTGNTGSKVYNGQAQSVTGYTVSSESNLFDATKVVFSGNAADSTASGTNVGEYPMGLAANMFSYNDGNINATFSVTDGSIEITPAAITINANDNGKVYGGTEPTLSATVAGVPTNGVAPVYSVSRAEGEDVGEYAITVMASADDNPNYSITTENGVFTITKATATVTANNASKVYGTAEPTALTATVSGLQNDDAASVITYTVSREAGEYVGDYTITPSGATVQGNYNVEYVNGTFSILPTVVFATEPMPTDICSEGSISVAFDATIAGNNGTMSFAWSRNHTDDVTGTESGTGNIEALTLAADATQTVTFSVTPTFTPAEGEAVTGEPVTFNITVNALPAVTATHLDMSCTEQGSATLTVTNGDAPLTCLWNNEETATLTEDGNNYTITFSYLEEGEYTFVITNGHGCTAQGSVVITNPVTISGSQYITSNEICANSSATVTYHITGGSADYTLEWVNMDNDEVVLTATASTADGTHSIEDLPAGSYHLALFITDVNGCNTMADDVVELTVWPTRNTMIEINVTGGETTYEFNGQTYPASYTPEDEHYTDIHGCDSIVHYVINTYPLDILIADRCTMARSSYTRAYSNTPHILYGDTIYVAKNRPTTFYAYINDTELTTWNDQKMDMSYELKYNEEAIANSELPSIVSNFSISTYYDRSGQYYGINNLTAATGEIPNNTLAFRQTANSTILHYDYFYFDAFKNIPNQVSFTPLESGTYTLKLMAELRNSTGGTNRNGIYNPYIVGRKYGHIWGGYGDRPGEKEVIATRNFTIIVNENGAAPSGAPMDVIDYAEEASVTIFPNPVNDQINIRISGMSGATVITITNAQGKVVRNISTDLYGNEEVLTYSVADFAQGMYFVNVRNSDKMISQKIVVTKR